MTDPFARLGSWMARYRAFVLIAWAVVAIVCAVMFAPRAGGVLKAGGIGAPGSESDVADRTAEREFGASVLNNISIVFRSDTLTVDDPNFAAEVQAVSDQLSAIEEVGNVISFYNLRDPSMVSEDRKTTFLIAALEGDEGQTQELVPEIRSTLSETTLDWYVTGLPAINEDFQHTSEEDLRRSELVTIPLVMILLLIVFRTIISAAIPLFIGAASVLLALTAIYFIASNADVSVFALNVASMIGLGLGIDFSLIVVSRYREEMAKGHDRVTTTAITMATAGRSITYSGITVVLSMLIMTVMFDLIIIRSIAMGVTIVAATSLIAGLTLLPAMIAALHHRLEWLRVIPKSKQTTSTDGGFWYRLSHAIMRRPVAWLFVSVAILTVLAYPVLDVKMIGADPGTLPQDIESVRGARIMEAEYGEARLTPVQVIMRSDDANSVWTPEFLSGLAKLSEAIETDERVLSVSSFPQFMRSPAGGNKNNLPPGTLNELVLYQHGDISQGPSFMGLASLTLEPGFELPTNATDAIHVIHVETGSLTFQTDGPATISERPSDPYPPSSQAPVSTPFTLQAGQNLIVTEGTPTSIRNDSGQPVELIVGVIYKVAPDTQSAATDWTTEANSDLFATVPKDVLAAGIVTDFPEGSVDFLIDRLEFAPGFGVPVHEHFGTEIGGVVSGQVQAYAGAPESSLVYVNGEPNEVPFSYVTLNPGDSWIHQSRGMHGARNPFAEPTTFIEFRVMASDQPRGPAVMNPPEEGLAVLGDFQPELFTGSPQNVLVISQFVNLERTNDTAIINITMASSQYEKDHEQFIQDLRDDIIPGIEALDEFEVLVGGNSASYQDFSDALYGRFPILVGAVLILTFFILMMFFQSVFLPLKAVFMNLISIMATYGALVLIFQHGYGANLLGFESLNSLSAITPAVLFVILFSLSTDYEVFMLSRVKEHYHETHDNEEAVAFGLQHTAGIITAAGLILIGTFGSFAVADILTVKEIGIGLAIGVLIDSNIVRVIMVPSTMRLAGAANWWMPAWLKKIVPELKEGPAGDIAPIPAPRPMPFPGAAPALAMSGGGAIAASGIGGTTAMAPPVVRRAPSLPVGRLHSIGGSVGTDVITLPRSQPFRIGRDQASELQVFDVRISRNHAQIEYRNGDFVVSDLGSTNGVVINGQRIGAPTVLRDNDRIEFGNMGTVVFRFELVRPN
ncbi:MAG TPA: MMPL family transporter [Thermomicrobiales bacterium]|nr:MMPL family transporter [Thermomicrobiales bacterium]